MSYVYNVSQDVTQDHSGKLTPASQKILSDYRNAWNFFNSNTLNSIAHMADICAQNSYQPLEYHEIFALTLAADDRLYNEIEANIKKAIAAPGESDFDKDTGDTMLRFIAYMQNAELYFDNKGINYIKTELN